MLVLSVATASLMVGTLSFQVDAAEVKGNLSSKADVVDDLQFLNKTKNKNNTELSNTMSVKVAETLGYEVDEDEKYFLIFGEELASYGIVLKSSKTEEELHEYSANIQPVSELISNDTKVVDMTTKEGQKEKLNTNAEKIADKERIAIEQAEAEEAARKKAERAASKKATFESVDQSDVLLEIDCPDENYTGVKVTLDAEDRDLLERLVMGEAGAEGFEGAALVAQAIRDTMVYKGFDTVAEVRSALKYSGSIKKEPNQNVLDAVSYIFDDGGCAVKHRIYYFYAYKWSKSKWHETQNFIIQYGGHRFFDS